MTDQGLSQAAAALRERITELSVHIPCGGLRGPLQQRSAAYPHLLVKWQSCRDEDSPERWAGHDVSREYDLCLVCCKATAGGSSRWSWLACEHCRALNQELATAGARPLPLGRHSIMNGVAIRSGANVAEVEQQATGMVQLVQRQRGLHTWHDEEFRRLATAFGADEDVPLREWQARWPSSRDTSKDAFARLLQWLSSTHDTAS
ncbi:hypothetical protein LT337_09855 [Mycolicibacterium fortuitum]|nr:hypothetical protein LT337_09855 [Mycolicibacterium fortuitum]